jgi:molybdopterin converting factor small subunit
MRVLVICNDGAGSADQVEVAFGTTVADLCGERLPERRPDDFLIRVNRQAATPEQVLREGDRVSLTPTKIEGAARS